MSNVITQAQVKAALRAQGKSRGRKARFSAADVEKLRAAIVEQGKSLDELAAEHKVSVTTISNAIRGRGVYEFTLAESDRS